MALRQYAHENRQFEGKENKVGKKESTARIVLEDERSFQGHSYPSNEFALDISYLQCLSSLVLTVFTLWLRTKASGNDF